MLQSIKLQKLRNSEFIQFFTDLIAIFTKNKPKELSIKEQLDPVIEDLENIKSIHGVNKGSDISAELKEIDDDRDDCINGIHSVAEGFTYHYDDEIKEAAELILNRIDHFGPSIAKQNYPTETTSLNGIADAFKTEPKLINALAKLDLTNWAGQMETKNNFFNQRYLDRVDEQAKQSDDKIKELRKTTTENYYTLKDHITAHATLKATDNYKLVINQLNELIDEYNLMINRRKGGKSGDETEE